MTAGDPKKTAAREERRRRRLEHTTRIQSEIALRNKRMMFRAHEALALEIEERKRTEAELRQSKLQAERLVALQGRFLANMSHELRTPLGAVIGMLDLTLRSELTPDQASCLSTASRAAHDLLELLNDVLDYSRLEAQAVVIEHTPFSPWDALDHVLAVQAPVAQAKRVEMALHVCTSVPALIIGDPLRLRQVVTNLVSNAVKFTDAGRIDVRIRHRDERLYIDVHDTGVGIASDRLSTIFEPFHQADVSTTRRFGGSGLGLTIGQHLATRMGGGLSATSVVGQGSTFSVEVAAPAGRVTEAPALLGLGVQIELMDPDEAAVLESMLRSLGATRGDDVLVSDDPDALLRYAQRGVRTLRIGRRGGGLTRPVLRTELRKRLEGLRAPTVHGELAPLRVLLVEDNATSRMVLQRMLAELGQPCVVACDGGEAVQVAREMPFDLILMDIEMPVLDGYGATQRVRAAGASRKAHIVALTASVLPEARQRCSEVGMDAFVAKPVRLAKLRELLASCPARAQRAG